jgi:arylsulfatase
MPDDVGYSRWWGEKLWTLVPTTTVVGQFLQTFNDYPPSQPTASTKVESPLLLSMFQRFILSSAQVNDR